MPEIDSENSAPAAGKAAEAFSGGGAWTSHFIWLLLGAGSALALPALSGLLAPVTGATHLARGVEMGAILAAVAAGLLLGRNSPAGASSCLIVSALALGLLPWVLPILEPVGGWILRLGEGVPFLLLLLRLAVALAVVAVPCAGLGAAFAVLYREQGWAGADRPAWALRMAVLSAGAALGTVNAGFRLLPWGGELAVSGAAAILLFMAAILSGTLPRRGRRTQTHSAFTAGEAAPTDIAGIWGPWIWGAAVAASLFAWDRILGLVLGDSPESASRTGATFLAGCTLGSLAVFALRGVGGRGSLGMGTLTGLAGLASAGSLLLVNTLPIYYLSIAPLSASAPFSYFVKSWGGPALLVMPAAIACGAILPFFSGPGDGSKAGPGKRSRLAAGPFGGILAGAFVASLAVPFWVIPHFGFRSTLTGASALILAFSAVAFALSPGGSRILRAAGIAAATAAVLLLAFRPPPGDPRLLASGAYRYAREITESFPGDLAGYRAARLKATLPFYREGREATVALERIEADISPILALTENGTVAATTYYDLVPQILSGEIPMLMRPAAREALLIGYGSGIGAGSMLLHPLSRLDLVEPEPEVVEASRHFEPANRTPRADPRVKLYAEDPRQVLRWKGRGAYDLILCRSVCPEDTSSRYLLTAGFYRLSASRLRKGGLFAQVLPLRGLSPADLASVVKTARSAFADVMVLQTYYQEILLLASDETLRFDLAALQAAMDADKVRSDLGRIGLPAAEGAVVVRHRLSGKGLEAFAREGRILTDRGAPLSWAGYRIGSRPSGADTQNAMDRYSTGLGSRIAGLPDGAEGNAVLVRLAKAAIAVGDATRAADLGGALISRGDPADGHQVLGDAYYLHREQITSVAEWHEALKADPKHVNALLSLADFSSDRQNFEGAEEYLRRALEIRPDDPEILYYHGRALYYMKRYKQSEEDFVRALSAQGEAKAPLALYFLGLIQKQKGNYTGAAEFLRRYLQWAYAQGRLTAVEAEVHLALAEVYTALKLPELADKQKKAGDVLQQKLKETAEAKQKAAIEWLSKP